MKHPHQFKNPSEQSIDQTDPSSAETENLRHDMQKALASFPCKTEKRIKELFECSEGDLSDLASQALEGSALAMEFLMKIAIEATGQLEAISREHPDSFQKLAKHELYWSVLLPAKYAARKKLSDELMDDLLKVESGLD